jgi:hypothetical protein
MPSFDRLQGVRGYQILCTVHLMIIYGLKMTFQIMDRQGAAIITQISQIKLNLVDLFHYWLELTSNL